MKANELRIGNIIQSPPMNIPRLKISSNGYMTVTGYGISVLESDTSNKLGWTSIPLSEEILLKVGFKPHETKIGCMATNKYKNVTIHLSNSGNWYFNKRIIQLHDLQNIVHANTGQELNTSGLL